MKDELRRPDPADYRRYPVQLGAALADPLLAQWLDPDRLAAFVRDELAGLDPFSQHVAEQEVKIRRLMRS